MSEFRKSAKGQQCQVRLDGICNGDPETTVLAHIRRPFNAGVGTKPHDTEATFACDACHAEIDRRTRHLESDFVTLCAFDGMLRTQAIWRETGLL